MTSWNDIDALISQMEENGLIRENGRVKSYGTRLLELRRGQRCPAPSRSDYFWWRRQSS